jgi:hypothetical protein
VITYSSSKREHSTIEMDIRTSEKKCDWKMSPKFLVNQPQNDITFLMKQLVTIGAKVPTTLEGGNHGHTNTITLQPSKTPSHTAEQRAETSSQVTNNTPKPRVETTITPQPS